MSEWVPYIDSLVAAGWTAEQIGWDLQSRGWEPTEALRWAVARGAPAPTGDPTTATPPLAAVGWGAAASTPSAPTPAPAAMPRLSEQLQRASEREELVVRIVAAIALVAVVAGTLLVHTTALGDELVGERLALILLPFGVVTLMAAVTEADWFFDRMWVRFVDRIIGRTGTRVLYVLSGASSLFAGLTVGLAPTYL